MTLKIEAGKKYRTRGGDEVEVLRTDLESDRPVLGILTQKESSQHGRQFAICLFEDGCSYKTGETGDDLVSEIRPKRTVWLNVYEGVHEMYVNDSREEADQHARYRSGSYCDEPRIACIRVEFEENQFDE